MKYDLSTKEGRTAAIQDINDGFIWTLRANHLEISPEAVCRVGMSYIELGIAASGAYLAKGFKIAFASTVELHCASNNLLIGERENEINICGSGNFDPSVKEGYWRTIHAAEILKNWEVVCAIVNTHCKMYDDLEKAIFKTN